MSVRRAKSPAADLRAGLDPHNILGVIDFCLTPIL